MPRAPYDPKAGEKYLGYPTPEANLQADFRRLETQLGGELEAEGFPEPGDIRCEFDPSEIPGLVVWFRCHTDGPQNGYNDDVVWFRDYSGKSHHGFRLGVPTRPAPIWKFSKSLVGGFLYPWPILEWDRGTFGEGLSDGIRIVDHPELDIEFFTIFMACRGNLDQDFNPGFDRHLFGKRVGNVSFASGAFGGLRYPYFCFTGVDGPVGNRWEFFGLAVQDDSFVYRVKNATALDPANVGESPARILTFAREDLGLGSQRLSLWVGGTGPLTNDITPGSTLGNGADVTIGRNKEIDSASSGRAWAGDFCELIMYDHRVTEEERVIVESCLSAKWLIPLGV